MHARSDAVSNLDIVRCFYDGLDSGEVNNPLDYFSEDMTWYVSDFLPWGGTIEGMPSIKAMLRAMRSRISGTFEVDELFEAGNEIVAVGRSVGFLNETNESYSARTVHVWRFSEGRAVYLACYIAGDSPLRTLS
jgi:ketosteroid isomerase-like protein